MKLGKVIGKVWATQKDPQLEGVKLYVLQPVDEHLQAMGKAIIAADAIGSGEDEIVFWVGAREATYAFPEKKIPADAAIVGIVDSTHATPSKETKARMQKWISNLDGALPAKTNKKSLVQTKEQSAR